MERQVIEQIAPKVLCFKRVMYLPKNNVIHMKTNLTALKRHHLKLYV